MSLQKKLQKLSQKKWMNGRRMNKTLLWISIAIPGILMAILIILYFKIN
jgi:hypothetical protein